MNISKFSVNLKLFVETFRQSSLRWKFQKSDIANSAGGSLNLYRKQYCNSVRTFQKFWYQICTIQSIIFTCITYFFSDFNTLLIRWNAVYIRNCEIYRKFSLIIRISLIIFNNCFIYKNIAEINFILKNNFIFYEITSWILVQIYLLIIAYAKPFHRDDGILIPSKTFEKEFNANESKPFRNQFPNLSKKRFLFRLV